MAREQIIKYRFVFVDSYPVRKKMPYKDRLVRLIREDRVGKQVRRFETLGTFTTVERDQLIELMGKFPLRERLNGRPDGYLGEAIRRSLQEFTE